MTKLWMSLGLINLFVTIGIFADQGLRYGIWWEWEEFLHHETFVSIFLCATLIFIIVALIEHKQKLRRIMG